MFSKLKQWDKTKWQKTLLVLVVLLFSLVLILRLDMDALQAFIRRHENISTLLFLLAYTALGFTPIPSEPVTYLSLSLKGVFPAILLMTLGNTLAALLQYIIAGNLADLADFESHKAKLPRWLRSLPVQSPVFLLAARAIPGLGPKFVSTMSGVYSVPLPRYLWTALLSNTLGGVFIVLTMNGILTLLK
ncbi:MAG: hypothetical protein SVR81_06980 [Chloroflexota bacterium]|nr:hypothetical protein [Chloroflexota bacterium]